MLYTCAEPFHLVQITVAQYATAEKCHSPGKRLGRPETRATDELGNKRISLSFSEEISVLTVAGNAHLQLFGVHREKNQLCHSLCSVLVWDVISNPFPERPFLL